MASFDFTLSSGQFGLPGNAASVDWTVLNNSANPQSFRVTVYKCASGTAKTPVAPGALTMSLDPGHASHNANSVGTGQPFVPGFYYEVVLETNSLAVMPTVCVWEDHSAKVIAGTTILAASFMRIK